MRAVAEPSLRILQLVTRRQLRGAEVFAGQLSEGLARRGCHVTLAGLYEPGEPPLTVPGVDSIDLGSAGSSRLSPQLAWRLRSLLGHLRPHVVQANGSDTLKYAVLARGALRHRPPLVYRSISIASLWLRGTTHRWWNQRLFRAVDHVAAVSRLSAADLETTYDLPPEVVTALPLATPEPHSFDPRAARAKLATLAGAPPEAPLVVHVGSATPEKNHPLLLEAFREVRSRCTSARLVLIGAGPGLPGIREQIADLDLAEAVSCLGARSDAADLAGGADLLVLSSRIEGTPGVVLEAGIRGVPAVATDVGAVREVVAHGRSGLLVPAEDARQLARGILELLESPARRAAMGRAARDAVRRTHDLEDICDRFLDLYRTLADHHE